MSEKSQILPIPLAGVNTATSRGANVPAADDALNLFRSHGDIVFARPGIQFLSHAGNETADIYYNSYIDLSDSTESKELIYSEDGIFRKIDYFSTSEYIELAAPNSNTHYFSIYGDGAGTYTFRVETSAGVSGSTTFTVDTDLGALTTTINGLGLGSIFNATPAISSLSAIVLPLMNSLSVLGNQVYRIRIASPEDISGGSSPARFRSNPDDELPARYEKVGDTLYFSLGPNLYKYDGRNIMALGLQSPTAGTATSSGVGSFTGDYRFLATYYYEDNLGNITESDALSLNTVTATSDSTFTLPIDSDRWCLISTSFTFKIKSAGNSRWGAVATGAATGNVIPVNSSYNYLDVGDPVYFYDSTTLTKRNVTARTSSSITVDGTAPTVASGTLISPILIRIYRTVAGGSLYYLSKEEPTDVSTTGNQNVTDTLSDASLVSRERYVIPDIDRSLFPYNAAKEVRAFIKYGGVLLVSTGKDIRYNDIVEPEFFPSENVIDDISLVADDEITAFGATDEYLLIFTKTSIHILTGDLASGNFSIRRLSSTIGCGSQSTVMQIDGVVYWAGYSGVYKYDGGGIELISQQIQDKFRTEALSETYYAARVSPLDFVSTDEETFGFLLKYSHSFYDKRLNAYVLVIPHIVSAGLATFNVASSETRAYAYSLDNREWWIWDEPRTRWPVVAGPNGIFFIRSSLYNRDGDTDLSRAFFPDYSLICAFSENRMSSNYELLRPNGNYYTTKYLTLGEPSILKKFLRLKLHQWDLPSGYHSRTGTNDISSPTIMVTQYVDYRNEGSPSWSPTVVNNYDTQGQAIIKLKSVRARGIKLKLSNISYLSGAEIEYVATYDSKIKE